uniref:Serine/threonine-protein phosphatase 4 regulatory subunit 2 n=1 Tax=Dendroctonus ponderosae TaxID=77166 RepID=A0AAR5PM34_DENPD
MENPEEILHSLEEFAKMKPKDIPRELEEYLKFVAKTGDPVYQWPAIRSLFREKLISVITEFYESCTSMEIPPCPNVEMFNYDLMKTFILEKLDTFASAPFTLQRICELLTSPRKEYTRIDKYMRALEKNILVVSTMEPCGRRTENGESIMNGVESDHETVPEPANEINVEEMDDFNAPSYVQSSNHVAEHISFDNATNGTHIEIESTVDTFSSEKVTSEASTSSQEIVCVQYVSIEPVDETAQNLSDDSKESSISLTITAINVKEQDEPPHEQERDSIQTEGSSQSTDIIMENITVSSFP